MGAGLSSPRTLQPIRVRITQLAGQEPEAAIDGCGVPCRVLPLQAMARAWARLAGAMADEDGSHLARIGWEMNRHGWDVCKIGAEGLICGALPHRRAGFALEVHSGHSEARAVATFALLARLDPGLISPAAAEPWAVIHNVVGRPVGSRVAVWVRG